MSKRTSRVDFVQQPYFKKSHNAMYVDIDGKPRRLCKGDKLTQEGREAYEVALKDRGKQAEPEDNPADPVKPGDNPSVAALTDDFLVSMAGQVRQKKLAARTLKWYSEFLQSFIDHIGVELLLSDLKPLHVEKWLAKAYDGASDNHRNGAVRAVSRVFNWARKLGIIASNPIAGFERPSPQPRECYLNADQWQQLSAMLKEDDPFSDFVWFLYLTGCRPFEARTAKASQFDRENKSIIFERANSKGKKQPRVIILEGRAFEIVGRQAGNEFIFTNTDGNAWTAFALNCRFARLRKKLGFELFPYIFRHTFITNALKRGLNPMTVATLAGHMDATMVMKVYGHLAKDSDHLRAELRKATGEDKAA